MHRQLKTKRSHRTAFAIIIIASALLILSGSYLIYAKNSHMWPFTNGGGPSTSSATNTATASHKNNSPTQAPSGTETAIINQGGNTVQGQHSTDGTGITDTAGQGVVHQSEGTSSSSGLITLYTPLPSQQLVSGMTVKGSSALPEVQYRISDADHGQIAQGVLLVRNGFFSGTLNLSGIDTHTGTFEVYSFNSQGQEANNIKVDITY